MCLFAENDILPQFNSLNVSKGGIETLLRIYQQEFVKMGYITNAPEVNLKSFEHFIQALVIHSAFLYDSG
ncbi:hypothetical protein M8C21_012913 [Ambrosia artemisiifolia]|uniref:Xrn1 helical domain-containing protein n=1 Tax=Ambrosia artemisiifolia TaxID=4212 RepID=A0AAD5GMB3_AMBAR|nr:hypothetical protein M8C21_012913 [Ambrosia artemisiifolia]